MNKSRNSRRQSKYVMLKIKTALKEIFSLLTKTQTRKYVTASIVAVLATLGVTNLDAVVIDAALQVIANIGVFVL